MPGNLDLKQLEDLVRRDEIDTVLTVFPDGQGRLMGKRVVGRHFLGHVAGEGVHACAYLLTVPAAFTLATTRDHWEVLLRARAIENQAFVIAPNQIGEHPPHNRSGGRSMIIDPWGLVLAVAPDKETHVIADLDMELLEGVRERLPALRHARPELLAGSAPSSPPGDAWA